MDRDLPEDEKLDEAVEKMGADINEMQARSTELGNHIEKTRSDWQSKQQDNAVPGAQPPEDASNQPQSPDESEQPD